MSARKKSNASLSNQQDQSDTGDLKMVVKDNVKISAICFTSSHFINANHLIYNRNVKVQLSILTLFKVHLRGIEHYPKYMVKNDDYLSCLYKARNIVYWYK